MYQIIIKAKDKKTTDQDGGCKEDSKSHKWVKIVLFSQNLVVVFTHINDLEKVA